jgi:beta-lactamase regulating signal transducer with metallopeptidase domain
MIADAFSDWVMRSFATGAVAVVLVQLCPRSWRGRFRLAVPVAAFAAMVLLACWLVLPLPRWKIDAPAQLTQVQLDWAPGLWVTALWALGAGLFLTRQAYGFVAIHNLLRATRAVPGREWRRLLAECQESLGLTGKIRLRMAGSEFIPSATGLLRRTVLLPDEAVGWTEEQRRLVLLHELAHFRRADLWTDALGRLACALHWFNPFAWLLHRQLAVEREYACDALVVERGAQPRDYAMVLWQMATASRRRPVSAAAYLAMASPRIGKLEQRVRRILDSRRQVGRWLRVADATLCTLLGVLLIACTACKPVSQILAADSPGPWTAAEIQARLLANPFPAN